MIEIQYSGTALLLLVNPLILHKSNGTVCPTYVFIIWKEDASLSAMFNPLYSSMNQQLFKKNFCNQSSPYENSGWFPFQMEAYHNFVVSKDQWEAKEGTAKSMKNALHVQWWYLWGWSDV